MTEFTGPAKIIHIGLVSTDKGVGFIVIPVEKIIDGEVVTVDTKAIPLITPEEK